MQPDNFENQQKNPNEVPGRYCVIAL